jgi:Methyltransferase domain
MDTPGSANPASQSTSAAPIPLHEKLRELKSIFLMRLSDLFRPPSVEGVFDDLAEYEAALRRYSGRGLAGASALEVGFGARPLRLFALAACGVDVIGSDLDVPLIRCSPREIAAMIRRNGIERAVKSVLRFALFDLKERRELDKSLRKRGLELKIEPRRLIVSDAAALDIPEHSLDFIYSEDVFEHIPRETLRALVQKMANWLKPSGLALIRPNVFTGIVGGHLAEWFPNLVSDHNRHRRSEPWEHLRKRRFRPNTYLNELSRASYRELFTRRFEILEERERSPELGREYLTPEVAGELSQWPSEELFSNQTLFILRPIVD